MEDMSYHPAIESTEVSNQQKIILSITINKKKCYKNLPTSYHNLYISKSLNSMYHQGESLASPQNPS
ncbi:hypothetical protein Hanom_Chr17g01538231 [Helianthus anomalus]